MSSLGFNDSFGDAFFAADPDGFFGLDLDGELAVTVSVVRYDPDVPVPNADGSALARDLGFEPVFETARMYRGPDPCLRLDRVFGVTTFELG